MAGKRRRRRKTRRRFSVSIPNAKAAHAVTARGSDLGLDDLAGNYCRVSGPYGIDGHAPG